MYSSCVEGITKEVGKQIADALHLGEAEYTLPEGKYDRVLMHEGYYYTSYCGPSSGLYVRIFVFPMEDNDISGWSNLNEVVVFDIEGNIVD